MSTNNKKKSCVASKHKAKFALIWWVDIKYKDVVKLNMIPKQYKKEQCIVPQLPWKDNGGKITKCKAKILCISGKYYLSISLHIPVSLYLLDKYVVLHSGCLYIFQQLIVFDHT